MSLRDELKSEQVDHLDLTNFSQVRSGTSVKDVVSRMRKDGVNVCLIVEGGRLLGIFTDRDVLHKVVATPETWNEPIDSIMTPEPISISTDAAAADALWLMDEKSIRHLPAVDDSGNLAGNMTHQTIIGYLAGRYPIEILNLPPQPEQYPEQVEGG